MSNYNIQISWSGKDALSDSDPAKVISGADFQTEFEAIKTAVNSKAELAGNSGQNFEANNLTVAGTATINNATFSGTVSGITVLPVGSVFPYIASSAPSGFLNCDGTAVSRTTYSDLFAVIGTSFGTGDGSTTFNLPDLRGRTVIGVGTGSGLTARTLAATGGAETHTLTVDEMPAHTHTANENTSPEYVGTGVYRTDVWNDSATNTSSTGGDQPHNNMQPFLVMNYIIKT
jgi:microcystin-dependent protein